MMVTKKWTNEFLDSMRELGDPTADAVVAEVIRSGGIETFGEMMRHLVNNRDEVPASLPGIVHDYFEETQVLPAWADREKIMRGERVFELYGPEMIMMLFFVSLPYAYATKKGSHVLSITAQLTTHVHRRIFRTAQFIMDVMQSGGLGEKGRGIRSAQKVRLIHASIRYYMAHKQHWKTQWDPAWGLPINQEDMAGTMMDFSTGVLRGLENAHIHLSPEEEEAYLHCWKVVGHIIGVRPELMPENVADAFDLAQTIIDRQRGSSHSGQLLTQDLVKFIQGFMPRFMSGFPATAIRVLSGAQIADVIQVSKADWTVLVLYLQFALFNMAEWGKRFFPGLRKYIRFLTWNLIDAAVLFEEGGNFYFEMPDYLRRSWRLSAAQNEKARRLPDSQAA